MHQSLIQKSLEHSDLYPHALKIVKKLAQNGFTAYFAGGCVRDALLGRTFHDIDIATEAHPSVIAKLFSNS
jgi:tRNA nucleotidyltransferase (CCA-adding enzyme)